MLGDQAVLKVTTNNNGDNMQNTNNGYSITTIRHCSQTTNMAGKCRSVVEHLPIMSKAQHCKKANKIPKPN